MCFVSRLNLDGVGINLEDSGDSDITCYNDSTCSVGIAIRPFHKVVAISGCSGDISRCTIGVCARSCGCTIISIECHGVAIYIIGEGCSVSGIASNSHNSRCPTREGVGMFCRSRLGRNFASIYRCLTVLYLVGSQCSAVPVIEGDGVLIHCSIILCRINYVTCYACNLFIPTRESISVLIGSWLGRCSARIYRCLTIRYASRLQYRSVPVLEGNGVLVDGFREDCCIYIIALYRMDIR